jgi:hypothetical protein
MKGRKWRICNCRKRIRRKERRKGSRKKMKVGKETRRRGRTRRM